MAIGVALPDVSLVLDTDVFTHWRSRQANIVREITNYFLELKKPPALTSMTVFETLYGFEKSIVKAGTVNEKFQANRTATERLIEESQILPFNQLAATIAAAIAARLSKSDFNKHSRDVFIASTAMAHGHGVATHNRSDFELIGQHLPPNHSVLLLAVWKR